MAKKILIVDDDRETCSLVKKVLDSVGYETHYCTDSTKAIATAAEIMPNIILLDIMMPEMDGTDVAEKLKATPALSSIPVVYLTVLADSTGSGTIGGRQFVPKPFSPEELIQKIKEIIG